MFRYRLKENNNILKPTEVDPSFLKSIERLYGKVDMEDDFFSSDLEKYYKVDSRDEETGGIEHTLIKLASFDDLIDSLSKANSSAQLIKQNKTLKNDTELNSILEDINEIFNKFRTHLRKSYPESYKKINLEEESNSAMLGSQPETPYAFKVKKKLKEASLSDFQNKRIAEFDDISNRMNNIYPALSNAKNKTSAFYSSNPESNKILYPTNLIQDYLGDIELILKQENQ